MYESSDLKLLISYKKLNKQKAQDKYFQVRQE